MKQLLLLRGLPGAGKSELARSLTIHHYEADMYFDQFYNGEFKPHLLKAAHAWCYEMTSGVMYNNRPLVIVSNTFTEQWEMEPYFYLADKYQYRVVSLIVENRHGNKSVHSVPPETVEKMFGRFDIKLREN